MFFGYLIVYAHFICCQRNVKKQPRNCLGSIDFCKNSDTIASIVMKKDTHPAYYQKATITCACGATYTIGATKEQIAVEICKGCHPFYTGKEKIIDAAGRIEKFKARVSSKKTSPIKKKEKQEKRSAAQTLKAKTLPRTTTATPTKKKTVKEAT